MTFLGVDLGTSGVRLLLVDEDGQPIGATERTYHAAHPHPGWSEQNPADWIAALEEAIADFAGCVLITSHDRWFLDRLATHILAFEGDSHVEWFEGNYEDYEEDKKRRLGDDALEPHRIKYKPLRRD